ncbi:MAG: ATP-binding protein [Deltaproteobacteria bacterium]|nr:ATP-binding protein [Deltaproteobacteria bacterium]
MGKKILVVDNHPMVLKLIANLLEKDGHEVRTAEDGLSALDILKSYVPDLIFVDLVMPNISGEKLCRIIRNMPHLQGVFLVILSAIAAEEELDFVALGADACIAKGSMSNLARHVARVLELASPEGRQEKSRDILGLDEVATREITRELLSSRKHFEIILRNMSEGILEFAPNRKIIFANPTAVALVGIPEEMLLGTEFIDIFADHSLETVVALLNGPSDSPRKISEEMPVLLNGRQVSLQFLPVAGDVGATTIVIIHDVTTRKQAEEKIGEQNRFLNKLIESLPHPFFVVGAKGYEVVLANSSAQRYLGRLAECFGQQISPVEVCKAPPPYLPFERVQQEKNSFLMEYVEQGRDGQETTHEIHAHPIFDKKGKVTQIIEYRLDITERKKAEQALRDSKDALQKALDNLQVAQQVAIRQEKLASIGTLASGVAHEILNPLNIIGTLAQVMQLEKIPASMRKNIDEMLVQIKRATKITNNLRTFSHQHAFEVRLVDVHALFDKTAALLEHDLNLDNVRVERHYAPDLSRIEADEDQLAQVFLNLMSNARDAMSADDKRIIVETRQQDNGVEIRFSDTGGGIGPDEIGKIFDPFFTTKDPGHGTGLGLWIVYSIIENHCGTIRVESEKGKGARFVIFLPTHQPGQKECAPAEAKQDSTSGEHG